jgi:2-polyprenyl-6-methoxyphenol hydroxylase-like FAD-dependent oxidoreductase
VDTDVIVVGAGPTGLLLANELGLAGIRTVVVEKLTERGGGSKALGLQPRSVEVFDLRGLLDPILGRAVARLPGGHFAGLPVPLDYRVLDTRHPYQVGIPQTRVEAVLEDRLAGYGIPLLRGYELVALAQDQDGVTATAIGPHGHVRLQGRYLVGCDGGRSTVRKLVGVGFPGRPGRLSMVVADVVFTAPAEHGLPSRWGSFAEHVRMRKDGNGGAVLIPLDDSVYRLLFFGPEQQTIARNAPVTDTEIRAALHACYGPEVELEQVCWASRFTDACRQAECYRTGRVLLAGDAAHIHLPVGGQGLNLGLQDAFNLGWKLAAELQGWASQELVDSYHSERHPVAARVLHNTQAQGVLMMTADEDVASLRDILADLLRLPEANRYLAGMISGLDVCYDMPGCSAHPLLGRRVPDWDLDTADGPTRVSWLLRSGCGLLLDFGQHPAFPDMTSRWSARVDHVSASRLDDIGAYAVLVRPDGYVCWTGATAKQDGSAKHLTDTDTDKAQLWAALTRWFGAPLPGKASPPAHQTVYLTH